MMPVFILALPYLLVAVMLFELGDFRNPDGTPWKSYDVALGCAFWPVMLIVIVVETVIR